ncbi:helix-turn-helix domain-containing protein [Photobacterium leiognathi]|uniref:helix-turn-helix domain-containing protein n=1 Tax=Photobacterium leiognathi TaxID=553611 RepID=UPI00273A0C4F|nr:helix-turn-helix domain-containing protein [Photobacterium leiognathi]
MKEELRKNISKDVLSAVKNHVASTGELRVTGLYNLVWGDIEHELIDAVLIHTRGNQSKAARMLGIDRNTLTKIKKRHN